MIQLRESLLLWRCSLVPSEPPVDVRERDGMLSGSTTPLRRGWPEANRG